MHPFSVRKKLKALISIFKLRVINHELLAFHNHLSPQPVFDWVRVVHLFSFLCCVFLFCLSLFCVLCPMLPVSLDCPFLIIPSVFSVSLDCPFLIIPSVFSVSLDCPFLITPSVFSVSLDCPFLITLSVFSYVYRYNNLDFSTLIPNIPFVYNSTFISTNV